MQLTIAFTIAVLALTGAAHGLTGTDEPAAPARLLVEKKILNKYLVEQRDIIVHYQIFNVGGTAAVDVTVNDASLPAGDFDVMSGVSTFTIARLAAGANVTHTVVYRPKVNVWGRFNFTSAEVTYIGVEGATDAQLGWTSEPGEGYIVSLKEFERKFSPHVLDWLAFALMTLPSLAIPYLLYAKSKARYESPSLKKGQ